jgi:hypothetical protein
MNGDAAWGEDRRAMLGQKETLVPVPFAFICVHLRLNILASLPAAPLARKAGGCRQFVQ